MLRSSFSLTRPSTKVIVSVKGCLKIKDVFYNMR